MAILILSAMTCICVPGKAQYMAGKKQELVVENFTPSHGVSQGYITELAFDKKGYLWFGTKDGLCRYDGNTIKVFRHNTEDSTSISNSYVSYLYIDSKDRIWTCHKNALDMFNRTDETFTHIRIDKDPEHTDIKNSNNWITEDSKGSILFGHGTGIISVGSITDKKGQVIHKSSLIKNNNKLSAFTQITEALRFIGRTKNGWLSFRNLDSIYLFNEQVITSEMAPITVSIKNTIWAKSRDETGSKRLSLYLLKQGGVLKKFDAEKKQFTTYARFNIKGRINSMIIEENKYVWMLHEDGYFLRANVVTNEMDTIALNWKLAENKLDNPDWESTFDRYGNIWLGSNGYGLYKLNTRKLLFRHWQKESELYSTIMRIAVAGNNALFDTSIFQKWLACHKKRPEKNDRTMRQTYPTHIVYDAKGYFWKATDDIKGHYYYCKINAANADTTIIINQHNRTLSPGVPTFPDHNGDLWLGSSCLKCRASLYKLNVADNSLEEYIFPISYPPIDYNFVSEIYHHPDGLIWLATVGGVFSFHPKTKKWNYYINKPGDSNSLSHDVVFSVCPDPVRPEKYMWFGTEGGGLNRLDIKTGLFRRFNMNHGLPNDVIYTVVADNHNNLWLSTNNGLCLFDLETFTMRNFTIDDGLPGNEFNRYGHAKDNAGNLYFEGINGMVTFDPDDFYTGLHPSEIIINNLTLPNKIVAYGRETSKEDNNIYMLPESVECSKELIFNNNDRMFTIGYALLDLSIPHKNRYKYKLEGFDNDWIDAGTKTEATFTNISPGTYTFKVQGCNSVNEWSEPASLKITILHPWWGTWWFRLSAVLLIVGSVYTFYRYRIKQLMKFENMRNSIALDLHDEIGSSLSSISLYATVVLRTAKTLPESTTLLLNKIAKGTTEIMEGMNDIVWATKADNDTLDQVIERTRAFAAGTTEAKGIELKFKVDKDTDNIKINMQQRKNIYMFFKEAVNNAIKHSGCSSILVNIRYNKNLVQISIQDNGKGFDKNNAMAENSSTGGNGLQSMELRARQIKAAFLLESNRDGTTISLSLPLK